MPRSASPGGGGRKVSRSRSSSRGGGGGHRKRSRSRSASRSPRRDRSRSPRGRSPPRGGGGPASSSPPPIGEIVRGEVRSVAQFGAFVRVDGYEKEGLLHVSCLATYRVDSVEDKVRMGDTVYAKVIGHDNRGEGKYNLDIRGINQKNGRDEAPGDRERGGGPPPPRGGGGGGGGRGPRDGNKDPPERDSEHEGTVASIESFGAFVSLPGYANDGLLHISKMRNERVNRVEDYLNIGDRIRVRVCRVDEDTGKYGLDMRDVKQDNEDRGRDRYRGGDPMDDRDRRGGGGGYRDDYGGRGGGGGGGYRDRDEADRYRDGGRR